MFKIQIRLFYNHKRLKLSKLDTQELQLKVQLLKMVEIQETEEMQLPLVMEEMPQMYKTMANLTQIVTWILQQLLIRQRDNETQVQKLHLDDTKSQLITFNNSNSKAKRTKIKKSLERNLRSTMLLQWKLMTRFINITQILLLQEYEHF